jgi:hypothetical protein
MSIDLEFYIARFAANADAIAALARGMSDDQARWKPAPTEWSFLEVICHLADEERQDFRTRVDYTLHRPQADWPPIDPEGWVVERAYNERKLSDALDDFLAERQGTLAWLRGLKDPDWESGHALRSGGSMTAGEVLGAWLAHDHLHLRQLNQLEWQHLERTLSPGALEYAGGW